MESGLPFHKCRFCSPRERRCRFDPSGGPGGRGYLHRHTDRRIRAVHSEFLRTNSNFPAISQVPFLQRIQRPAKQGQEMGAILHNTVSNRFNDSIHSYLSVIDIFLSSLALLIFFLILSVYFCCRFIRCAVKCHLAVQNCHRQHFMNGIIHWQTI